MFHNIIIYIKCYIKIPSFNFIKTIKIKLKLGKTMIKIIRSNLLIKNYLLKIKN